MSNRPKPIKLTPAQVKLLDKICRTNGGGVPARPDNSTVNRLVNLGFIQGKSGRQWWAVHTRPGLEYWREFIERR